MDFGARATMPRTENPKTKLDKQTLSVSFTTLAAENRKTKLDKWT